MFNRVIGRYGKRQYRQAWDFLLEGSFSGVSSLAWVLNQSLVDKYRAIQVRLTDLIPPTLAANLWLRTSSDFGSTYDAGASDYAWSMQVMLEGSVGAPSGFTSSTHDSIFAGIVGPGAGSYAEWTFYDLNFSAPGRVKIKGDTSAYQYMGFGHRIASSDINAIEFFTTDDTVSGKYLITGMD